MRILRGRSPDHSTVQNDNCSRDQLHLGCLGFLWVLEARSITWDRHIWAPRAHGRQVLATVAECVAKLSSIDPRTLFDRTMCFTVNAVAGAHPAAPATVTQYLPPRSGSPKVDAKAVYYTSQMLVGVVGLSQSPWPGQPITSHAVDRVTDVVVRCACLSTAAKTRSNGAAASSAER